MNNVERSNLFLRRYYSDQVRRDHRVAVSGKSLPLGQSVFSRLLIRIAIPDVVC